MFQDIYGNFDENLILTGLNPKFNVLEIAKTTEKLFDLIYTENKI